MDKLICSKYAAALFELAKEKDKCLPIEDTAKALLAAMEGNHEFKRLLGHPDIDGERKLSVIRAAFAHMDKDMEGFISLIFERGRGTVIDGILESYIELSREHRNVVSADIAAASPLTEAQLKRLVSALEKKLNKTVEPNVRVDSSLLGGLKITVCGRTINSTIKSRLEEIKSLMESSKMSEERRDAV